MAGVTLREVTKTYGDVVAVDRVSLEVDDGEILLGDRAINDLDPKDRDLAMVFQNYALYPNKTVFENLAFPLRMRKVAKSTLDSQVKRTANVLSIEHLLDRHPRQLSGGQQQRVALGRALV